jgi:hypothetical protein
MKKQTNALILQRIDTRHTPTCFGTLNAVIRESVNHDPAEIGAECSRNRRWMDFYATGHLSQQDHD